MTLMYSSQKNSLFHVLLVYVKGLIVFEFLIQYQNYITKTKGI